MPGAGLLDSTVENKIAVPPCRRLIVLHPETHHVSGSRKPGRHVFGSVGMITGLVHGLTGIPDQMTVGILMHIRERIDPVDGLTGQIDVVVTRGLPEARRVRRRVGTRVHVRALGISVRRVVRRVCARIVDEPEQLSLLGGHRPANPLDRLFFVSSAWPEERPAAGGVVVAVELERWPAVVGATTAGDGETLSGLRVPQG